MRKPAHRSRQRVTFRLDAYLVEALRQLPNQTTFVGRVLHEALGRVCPLCHGTGEAPGVHLNVSNLKNLPTPRLDRTSAAQLKALVRLGRELMATDLALEVQPEGRQLGFRLAREDQLLLTGRIPRGASEVTLEN